MPIKKNSGRQDLLVAFVDVKFSDLAPGANPAIEVPHGAVLVGGDVVVTTPFNSATSATGTVGDKGDADRYGTVDLKQAGRTALTITGHKHSVADSVLLGFAQVGSATAGALRLTLHYYVEGRAAFSQG